MTGLSMKVLKDQGKLAGMVTCNMWSHFNFRGCTTKFFHISINRLSSVNFNHEPPWEKTCPKITSQCYNMYRQASGKMHEGIGKNYQIFA